MSFLVKNCSLVKVIYIYINIYIMLRLGSSCETLNTNDTDRNGVDKQNTHTKHSEKDNTGKV